MHVLRILVQNWVENRKKCLYPKFWGQIEYRVERDACDNFLREIGLKREEKMIAYKVYNSSRHCLYSAPL